jgi:Uma2 family endonuclease
MSHPAVAPVPFELVYDDGEPMENFNHVLQMTLLFDVVRQAMEERGRSDFFVGGNTFVYYSLEQARAVAEDVKAGLPSSHPKATFRGPDVFFVDHVPGGGRRKAWVAWEEGGRLPDLIVEMLSPSTERIDRKTKKSLYAEVFRTRDYFLFDWDKETLEGYRLAGNAYEPIAPDGQGRLHSAVLGLDLGLWKGIVRAVENGETEEGLWVRLFDSTGRMIPTLGEAAEARAAAERARADAEHARAEAERARAEAAEAELKRLRSLLGGSGG